MTRTIDEEVLRELCRQYKEDPTEELQLRIIDMLKPLIMKARSSAIGRAPAVVRKEAAKPEIKEDINSDILLFLVSKNVIERYDPDRGTSPCVYFYTVILNAAMTSLARTTRSATYITNESDLYRKDPGQDIDIGGLCDVAVESELLQYRNEWVEICGIARRSFQTEIVDFWESRPDLYLQFSQCSGRDKDRILNAIAEQIPYSTVEIERAANALNLYIRYRFADVFSSKYQADAAISVDELMDAVERFYPEVHAVLSRLGAAQRMPVLVALEGIRLAFPPIHTLRGCVKLIRRGKKNA